MKTRNQIYTLIILSTLSLAMSACSTKSVKSEGSGPRVEDVSVKASTPVKRDSENATKANESEVVAPVKMAPVNPTLSQQLSDAVKNQKDQDIAHFAGLILLENPNDLKALNSLALYNFKKSRYPAAEYLLKKAAQQYPNSSEVHSNLGLIRLAQNERRDAVLEFRKALQLNPDDPVAAANVGSIYIEEKDYEKALVALETVVHKGWKDYKILANYAIALTANGKYEKAEETYKSLLKEQTSNREILLNYAILQIEHLKKYDDGLETINRLKFIGPPQEARKTVSALEAKAKSKRTNQ